MPSVSRSSAASNVSNGQLTLAREPRFSLAYRGTNYQQIQLRVDLPPDGFTIEAKTARGRNVKIGASRGGAGDAFTTVKFPGTFTKPNPRLAGFVPVGSNLPRTVSAPLKDGDPVSVTITDNAGRSATYDLSWQTPDKLAREADARDVAREQDAYKNYPHMVWTDERGNRFVSVGDVTLAWSQRHLLEKKLCENKRANEIAHLESRVERAEERLQASAGSARHWNAMTGGPRTPLWVEARATNVTAGIRGARDDLDAARAELQNALNTRLSNCGC